jgi:Tfp pilus assembly protein FimT
LTLLEVLVCIVILGVVYAIGVPSLQAMRAPYALQAAVTQVAMHVDLARQRAIARNARHRIAFAGGGYQIERETSPNSFVSELGLFLPPHEVTIGPPDPADPVFNTRGMLAANVTVPVTVDGVGTRTVTINVLGRTTIQ